MELRQSRALLAERPNETGLHRLRAALLRQADDIGGAEAALKRALACAADPDAMLELADLLCLQGGLEAAMALVDAAVATAPLHEGAWRFAASLHFDMAEWGRAGRAARRALVLTPADAETWRILGHRSSAQGATPLQRALALAPGYRLARYELADAPQAGPAAAHRLIAIGAGDWRDLPVIINSRDRLTPLMQLLDWLRRAGHRNLIILDNQSTYLPLLRFFDGLTGVRLVRLAENLGHMALWRSGLLDRLGIDTPFVYTDPDIVPDEACPLDAVDRFARVLLRHGGPIKVGFGLRIDDLPDHYRHKQAVIDWESQYWTATRQIRPGEYWAQIDTTFALHTPRAPYAVPGIRTGPPYVARHLAWYADTGKPDEEERYYQAHAAPSVTTWTGAELSEDLTAKIRRLRQAG
jgi:tetratricopeptide (TPR) repeat protein